MPGVIPRQIGGHSPIKHVFVIVKENRTYDQVLGDLGEGNGDAELAQFGQKITPNAHALAKRFGDLDDFYDEGTLSADGHNWIVQAEANDYVEKEFGAFYRSYPAEGGDALNYQRDGFLWNAAQKAGQSVKDFGEYNRYITGPGNGGTWKEWYEDSQILEGKPNGPLPIPITRIQDHLGHPVAERNQRPRLPEVRPRNSRPVPLRHLEGRIRTRGKCPRRSRPDTDLAADDHTGGAPDPVAQVADNDLAFGRIVETISHSKVWKNSAVFGVEDDTQNGVDHVDGHRAPAFVISPYAKGGVQSEYSSQLNMVRTVEQILGIHPMNQEDYAAEPMYGAFTETPNFEPFTAVPNEIPLTLGARASPRRSRQPRRRQRHDATRATRPREGAVPASMQRVHDALDELEEHQRFLGPDAIPDAAKPVLLNRFDWYSAHNWKVAYPGDRDLPARRSARQGTARRVHRRLRPRVAST